MPPFITQHTIVAYLEDLPGVLTRVTTLVRRRGYNIASLAVGGTEKRGVSRLTLVFDADADGARRLVANLYKLVNVLFVEHAKGGQEVVSRELALVKVAATSSSRGAILQLIEAFNARAVDIDPASLVIELTDSAERIDSLVQVLEAYGILELVRTGTIAMRRGVDAAFVERRTEALSASMLPPAGDDDDEAAA
jgi:acetolactate synthase-1/3 small subunit